MTENAKNLRDHLARLYYKESAIERVVANAGLEIWKIERQGAVIDQWHSIVLYATYRHKIGALVNAAIKDYPEDVLLGSAVEDGIEGLRGPEFNPPVVSRASLEKITQNSNTLLPVHFLSQGVIKARSVARVLREDGVVGTGFLLGQNWFITNNHVLSSKEIAQGAKAQFNYEATAEGAIERIKEFFFKPDIGFYTSPWEGGDDWTALKIDGDLREFGYLKLKASELLPGEFVNIIQHAGGFAKTIAIYHNTVISASNRRVRYLTDTLPGSSGSPVFDSKWEVVALHHSSACPVDPDTGKPLVCNEGIPASILIHELSKHGVV